MISCPCKKRHPPDPVSLNICPKTGHWLLLHSPDFKSPPGCTLTQNAQSENHPIRVGRVVVVDVTVVVHVIEVSCAIRRPQPPVVRRTRGDTKASSQK